VLAAAILCAQLGLEPGPLGHAYLVPFQKECTFILGYKGMIELARRSGLLKDLSTGVVREGDTFTFRRGSRPLVEHVDARPEERGDVVCYWGVARFAGGGCLVERLWPAEIEAARNRSPAGKRGVGPWHTDFEAMARKTVVRRMAPYLPMTPLLARALETDEHPVIDVDYEGGVTVAGEDQHEHGTLSPD
jgi:recombination protein RecT